MRSSVYQEHTILYIENVVFILKQKKSHICFFEVPFLVTTLSDGILNFTVLCYFDFFFKM